MTYQEKLIQEAEAFWANRDRLPMDLFAKMVQEGLAVAQLEHDFLQRLENESNG
jgi:hypothetical protein